MKAATVLAALPAVMASSFTGLSVRSGSPIQYGSINANGGAFYIGKPTQSYCPESVGDACPDGTYTVFSGGDDTLSMDVEVPGGQQVYIAPSGALTFTAPHSASMPEGSISNGFTLSEGTSFGYLSWTNGFVACPSANGSAPYQVFGAIPSLNTSSCLGFDFLASNATGVGAWEYE
ncbi:hypothetical protein K490DRAFT_73039 [Saccharata proteae CBS 121410]|uniref:IgE-binding protein n=1 Tax=Saccharata proteae CBS 121410 TaxID=1314787 RepID=A0A9P4HY90_9PEZI|nr:hypothetical protein K490DRAFT_73039 [Saccharata proteae CBS 121410]